MLDSIQDLLDAFPEGVVYLQGRKVAAANFTALQYLPQLTPGESVPLWLPLPWHMPSASGNFAVGQSSYTFSYTNRREDQFLLFRPAAQTVLTQQQLERSLFQLRTLLGDILAEVGPATAAQEGQVAAADFGKTFHRLFRLTENLELMARASQESAEAYRLIPFDLEGLCRRIVARSAPLLEEAGVTLNYESTQQSLLIPGVEDLIQRLVLGLIANAAQAAGEGQVTVSLTRAGRWARLTVSDNGPVTDPRQLANITAWGTDIPLAGQGAGLGLSVATFIAKDVHHGSLLRMVGGGTSTMVVSLPIGAMDGRLPLHSPSLSDQSPSGLDPILTALSDVLPAQSFGLEGLD